jgi:hypothetical protein
MATPSTPGAVVKVLHTPDRKWRIELTEHGGARIYTIGPSRRQTLVADPRNAVELERWLHENNHPFDALIED